ncbi:MAG: hypothetical protein AABZ67_00560 [Pseudomonadota bacterium]
MLRRFVAGLFLALAVALPLAAQNPPPTSGGLSTTSFIAAASDNAGVAKATFGQVYGLSLSSISSSPAWLKLYDKAAAPTCGTDTPKARFVIPSLTTGVVSNIYLGWGETFSTGIAYCVVSGAADNSTVIPAASVFTINLFWK